MGGLNHWSKQDIPLGFDAFAGLNWYQMAHRLIDGQRSPATCSAGRRIQSFVPVSHGSCIWNVHTFCFGVKSLKHVTISQASNAGSSGTCVVALWSLWPGLVGAACSPQPIAWVVRQRRLRDFTTQLAGNVQMVKSSKVMWGETESEFKQYFHGSAQHPFNTFFLAPLAKLPNSGMMLGLWLWHGLQATSMNPKKNKTN